jgi:phosphoglycerate dehydrogenase-like enzyme
MATFKTIFMYQEPWEAERFENAFGDEMQVVAIHQRTDIATVGEENYDADMIVGGGVRSIDTGRLFTKLKLIQTLSAGTDWIPKMELSEMGVQWNQMNNLGTYAEGFSTDWARFHELTGKRVGIVGLGQIGGAVAKRLQGWECEVVYHDTATYSAEYEAAANAKKVDFDELIETSDIVSLHVPLDRSTNKLLSDREFKMMKPDAIVVNACRGPVVDEAALIRALDDKQIAGAGLDVTEIEPIEMTNSLLGRPNVVLLPHRAGTSIEARQKSVDNAIGNARRLMADEDPEGIVLPV